MLWILIGKWFGFYVVPSEAPCWKGELRLGLVVVGWQRNQGEGQ